MPSFNTPSAAFGSPFSGLSPLFSAATPASVSYPHALTESAQQATNLPSSTPLSGGYDHVFSALGDPPFHLDSPSGSPIAAKDQGVSLHSSPELPRDVSYSFGFQDSPLIVNFLPETTEADDVFINDALSDSSRSSSGLNTAFLGHTSDESRSPLSDRLSSLASSSDHLSDDSTSSSGCLNSRSSSSDQLSDDVSHASTGTTHSDLSEDLKIEQSMGAKALRSSLSATEQGQDNQWSFLNQRSRSGRMPVKKAVFSPSHSSSSYRRVFGRLTLEQSHRQSQSKANKSVLKSRAKRSTSMVKISKSKPVDENRASFSYANLSKGHRIDENRAPLDQVSSSMFQPAKSVPAESARASDQIQAPAFTPMPTL